MFPQRIRSLVVRLIYPTFTVGATVAITDSNNRLVLVQKPFDRGWTLPGGLLSGKEQPRETAQRELREELAVDLALTSPPLVIRTPGRRHFNFLFKATIESIDVATFYGHTPEISDVNLFDLKSLPDLTDFTDHFLQAAGLLPSTTDTNIESIDETTA